MPDKKPFSVRILLGLIFLKILVAPIILALYLMTGDVDASDMSFLAGIRQAINNNFGVGYGISGGNTGYLIGKMLIPLLVVFALLFTVSRRKFKWAVVAVCFDLLVSMAGGMPVMSIVILVLVLTNPTKRYLQRKDNKNTPPSEAPIDYELMNNGKG